MTASEAAVPEILYTPSRSLREGSRLAAYVSWLRETWGLDFTTYPDLWRWSVQDIDAFWASIWDYFSVISHSPHSAVLGRRQMPGAQWFPGATLNFAEHLFRFPQDADEVRVVAVSQTRPRIELTYAAVEEQVRRVRAGLAAMGVGRGDRVVAYLPNLPEAMIACYAAASLGAVWASCAPEFGAHSVIERFSLIEPSVLFAVSGYTYGDKLIDRRDDLARIREGLPTVHHVVDVPYGPHPVPDAVPWADLTAPTEQALGFAAVPFDHPLYVLFSSGTTGRPKAIVHSHGGILLSHLKDLSFHLDLGPGDRFQWFSTTAWMLWNVLASAPLVRACVVPMDGNPLHPDLAMQFRTAAELGVTVLGAGPAYLMACRKAGLAPAAEYDLSRLRVLAASGSPLPVDGFRWVHEQFGDGVLLNDSSGGTDICGAIVQANPLSPVYAGEMSGCTLGIDAKAVDAAGTEVVGELGELVIAGPIPSMPVGLWGDPDGRRYRETYFDTYPGIWRHGDWARFSSVGSCVITGRSDATLNRGGVRLGTGEFYRVVEQLPEVADSLVVHVEDDEGGMGELVLFVVLAPGVVLDDALRQSIRQRLRGALSPRHVPDTIAAVAAIPYNRTGKKLEIPVKRLLQGASIEQVAAPGALLDPASLDPFVAQAHTRTLRSRSS